MQHIVFLDHAVFKGQMKPFTFEHTYRQYETTSAAEVVEHLQDATIVISNSVRLGEAELSQLPALKLIAVAATGTDIIDLEACATRGIVVTNVQDWCTGSVPEHTFGLMLARRRRLFESQQRDDTWAKSQRRMLIPDPLPIDLQDSTLGIVGYGTLGRRVADIARAFGMNVLISEHRDSTNCRSGYVPFADVLRQSDILVLLCPLTAATYHLIGATELATMKSSAIIINSGRGGVIDELALADALSRGAIAGAGLDVLEQEPPVADHPLIGKPNVIITPHIAWASAQSMQYILDQLVDNIEAFVRGEPQHLIAAKLKS